MMEPSISDGGNYTPIVPYKAFTNFTPALPQFYWDVYSSEQRIKQLCQELDKLVAYANMLGTQLNATEEEMEELKELLQSFIDTSLPEYLEKYIREWIEANTLKLWQTFAKQVFFGLTDEGYFCAYVPDSWSDIVFDTGAVFGRSDYGRLILKMNVSGETAIDNTYSYSLSQVSNPDAIQRIIADLEVATKRGDKSFDTLFTNLDTEVNENGNL